MTPGWLTFAQEASLPTLAISALLLAIVAVIKVWPQLRQMQIAGDATMRAELLGRIHALETRVADLEKLISQKDINHATREQFLRHALANEESALDAALSMLRVSPDRITEIINEVTAIREA